MQEINLNELVSLETANAFSEDEMDQIQAVPNKTRRAIPESVKGFAHPLNINQFIGDIYPNMIEYVSSKLVDRDMAQETINDFVVYMLSPAPTRNNVPHWRLYDAAQYSKQPYYKWFLINLRFFCQSANRNLAISKARNISLVESFEEAEEASGSAITLDMIPQLDPTDDPVSMLIVKDVAEYLEAHSKKFEGRRCFDAYAYQMFVALMNGATKRELAQHLQISPSATGQWVDQLRKLVRSALEPSTPNFVPAM